MTRIEVGGHSVKMVDLKFGLLCAEVALDFGHRRPLIIQAAAKTPWLVLMTLALHAETAVYALQAVDEDEHAETVNEFAYALDEYVSGMTGNESLADIGQNHAE
jgi:hypothetical protein